MYEIPSRDAIKDCLNNRTNKEAAIKFNVSERTIARWVKYYGLTHAELKYGLEVSQHQMNLLVGSLLGDGGLEKQGRFKVCQRLDRKEYVEWLCEELKPFSCGVYKDKKCWRFYTGSHPIFKKLRREWYPDGVKVVPSNISLNKTNFLHWYLQDGSNRKNKREIILATNCFKKSEADRLSNIMKKDLGIKSSVYTNYGQPVIYVGSDEYFKAIDLVSDDIIWPCFGYKSERGLPRKQQNLYPNKLNINKAIQIRKLFSLKQNKVTELSEMFGVCQQSIYNVINKITYKEKDTASVFVIYNPK